MGDSGSPAPASPASSPIAVAFDGVCKRFGATIANDNITFDVRAGAIHGIVGENGAGKSTLMNLLYGVHRLDAGCIRLWGTPARFQRPRDAIAAGVGMIHQRLSLVPSLTVVENVILGREPRRLGRMDLPRARRTVQDLAATHGLAVDLDARVGGLDVGAQQRVEVLKALYRHARILVLDEPTTTLAASEYAVLVRSLRNFAAQGGTVLYISHRLPEVFDLCDTVTVLRGGAVVDVRTTAALTRRELAGLMVGNENVPLDMAGPDAETPETAPLLELRAVCTPSRAGETGLAHVTLTVHRGEILGVAGVAGNGQGALARVLAGAEQPTRGDVLWDQRQRWTATGVRTRRRAGLGWIPGDRGTAGLVASLSVADNLALGRHARAPFARWGVRRLRTVRTAAAGPIEMLQVRPGLPTMPVGALSGGNQQKVLVARETEAAPRLLVAEHPTRGVDIATAARIHQQLRALRGAGGAVVMVASDLEELLHVADRIAVLYRGRVVRVVRAADTTAAELAPLLGGVLPEDTDGPAA